MVTSVVCLDSGKMRFLRTRFSFSYNLFIHSKFNEKRTKVYDGSLRQFSTTKNEPYFITTPIFYVNAGMVFS
jgi:hypothetical protein